MPWIATAPLFMVFCGDNRRIRRVAVELRGRPFPNDTLDMFMNAAVDAGMVLQGFITAAEALGLGCCPISVVRNHVEKLAALLELPPGVFPVAGLCVGYPSADGLDQHAAASRAHRPHRPLRRRRSARPRWRPMTGAARRATPRRGRASASPIATATREPYGWSEDKARQYSVPERHNFGPFIRGHGFELA